MTRALLVTHGALAETLVNCAGKITGCGEGIDALSNESLSLGTLIEKVGDHCRGAGSQDLFLFVDFAGSSCHTAAMKAMRSAEQCPGSGYRALLTGVNLPMLLAFLNKKATLSRSELLEAVLERASGSIKSLEKKT